MLRNYLSTRNYIIFNYQWVGTFFSDLFFVFFWFFFIWTTSEVRCQCMVFINRLIFQLVSHQHQPIKWNEHPVRIFVSQAWVRCNRSEWKRTRLKLNTRRQDEIPFYGMIWKASRMIKRRKKVVYRNMCTELNEHSTSCVGAPSIKLCGRKNYLIM